MGKKEAKLTYLIMCCVVTLSLNLRTHKVKQKKQEICIYDYQDSPWKYLQTKGESSITLLSSTKKTKGNYSLYIETIFTDKLTSNTKALQKSNSRYTAEHSLIRMMTYLLIIAVTHYSPGESNRSLPNIGDATDRANTFYGLVKKK